MRVPFAVIVAALSALLALLTLSANAGSVRRAGPAPATTHTAPRPAWMSPLTRKPNAKLLYVSTEGCNCVTVYNAQNYAPLGQLNVASPVGVTTGPDGTVWVWAPGGLVAFAPGQTKPFFKIPFPANNPPIDVRITDDGTVIAASFNPATIRIFLKGATKPVRTLDYGSSLSFTGLAVDRAGDFYLSEYIGDEEGRIVKIPAGQTHEVPLGAILATPGGLAFDGSGNLLVDDFDNATTFAFAPNETGPRFDGRVSQPFRTIGVIRTTNPTFLTFDRTKQTLYVGNGLRAEVDVFRAADGALMAIVPALGGYGTYIGVATSPRAPW